MRRIIRVIVPAKCRLLLNRWVMQFNKECRLCRACLSDYRRYRKYALSDKARFCIENLSAMIIMEAHALEKGFSLPEVKPGYGVERIRYLISLLKKYIENAYDCDGMAFKKAQSVLAEYIRYHDEIEYDLKERKDEILPWIDMNCDIGGYTTCDRVTLIEQSQGDFLQCALSRSSIRNYSSESVPEDIICAAVDIARKTPSVCNRQPWHTYIIKNPELKNSVLDLQNGNRGFGVKADFLAIITTDFRAFRGVGERNEAYTDGGLFAMSLMYAFHYYGIGACPLNWMVEPSTDTKLKRLLDLSDSYNVIMILSAGYLPDEVRVAKSVRRNVKDQLTIL